MWIYVPKAMYFMISVWIENLYIKIRHININRVLYFYYVLAILIKLCFCILSLKIILDLSNILKRNFLTAKKFCNIYTITKFVDYYIYNWNKMTQYDI